ncbi:MAG: hypothetical protein ACK5L6_07460 [Anaerorhabdus sp.]|uniref:hypothetical protein n=1 Tax=Anaerorhabdus sp. TaxID=1872524 RepID=UPI003A83A0E4
MNKPILIYDYDGTLTTNSVPRVNLMDELGCTPEQYEQKMKEWIMDHPTSDVYDAYYITFLNVLREKGLPLTDETFKKATNISDYNPGIFDYFEDFKDCAHHYLVSSGFKIPLIHTPIAKYLKEIYGTTFAYDENGYAYDIDYAMNDKKKVDKIKEICEMHNRPDYDCTNMVYLGDGLTDAYAMEFMKSHGGTAIFVHQPHESLDNFNKLYHQGIVDIVHVADYSRNSTLYTLLKGIINGE